MKVPPDGIGERELSRALEENWGLAVARLSYAPVGFGDHHWAAADLAGHRWFVTVAALSGDGRGSSPAAGYADLRASMETVLALHGAGLEFAVPPVRTAGGQALAPLGARHAIMVFPYLDGAAADEGPGIDRRAPIEILARLHSATPVVLRTAPVRGPDLASRQVLLAALGEVGRPWHGGPFSEPARRLLARHADRLGRALSRFDELVREAGASGPPVITHGEPGPGNMLRVAGTLRLIDWGTAGLALPERDLWAVTGAGGRDAERYAELTGHRLSAAAMRMYRMRWSLDEIAFFLGEFRRAHERTEDTELAWATLTEETGEIRRLTR